MSSFIQYDGHRPPGAVFAGSGGGRVALDFPVGALLAAPHKTQPLLGGAARPYQHLK